MTERNENEIAQHAVQEDTSAFELPFGFTPAHLMAAASLPLCIGTYAGYKRQLKIVQKEAAQHAAEGEAFTITRESKLVARRALGLGTMLSLSGFGLLTSIAFYASGCRSWQQAVNLLHDWAPRKRREFENWFGIKLGISGRDHEDSQATRGMTNDEELEYYRTKYFSEETPAEPSSRP